MGRILHPLMARLASATRQDLALPVAYLNEVSRSLRARLTIPHSEIITR